VLAGFVSHRLQESHALLYRHHDTRLRKVFYLALENEGPQQA
jgi:hypothetical protein